MVFFVNNSKLEILDKDEINLLMIMHKIISNGADCCLDSEDKMYNGLAVAVNGNIVPRINWNKFLLQENDKIMLIRAACGG